MTKREKRASDTNGSEDYRKRRFFNNGTIYKMLIAALIGGGGTQGVSSVFFDNPASKDHDKVVTLEQWVKAHGDAEDAQTALFNSKLETLNAKVEGIDSKLEILIRRSE